MSDLRLRAFSTKLRSGRASWRDTHQIAQMLFDTRGILWWLHGTNKLDQLKELTRLINQALDLSMADPIALGHAIDRVDDAIAEIGKVPP